MTHHSTVALPGNPDMSQYFTVFGLQISRQFSSSEPLSMASEQLEHHITQEHNIKILLYMAISIHAIGWT
jgi:hypothetical protein